MKPATRSFYEDALQRVIERILTNLDESPQLGDLAAAAGLSPFHFHRIFRGMVGETPLEFSRRLRMERAAWRLAHTSAAVTDIAFDAGYETHEAFTRAFRLIYNTSPSGFRDKTRPRIEIATGCGVHYRADGSSAAFVPRDTGGQNMEVAIKDMPAMRVATVPHVGPYNQINDAFGKLGAIAGPAGLFRRPEAAMVGIYYDDPQTTPSDELRSEAGLRVADDLVLPAGLETHRLAAGRYACTLHVGPYEQLGDVWARFLGEWLPKSGHHIRPGASFELYLNDPTQVATPELRTEIYQPIA